MANTNTSKIWSQIPRNGSFGANLVTQAFRGLKGRGSQAGATGTRTVAARCPACAKLLQDSERSNYGSLEDQSDYFKPQPHPVDFDTAL